MALSDYTLLGPVCYQGKADCLHPMCRRQWVDGEMVPGCMGYHCSYCDAPCGMMGHRCDASEAVLGEARRQADLRTQPKAAPEPASKSLPGVEEGTE